MTKKTYLVKSSGELLICKTLLETTPFEVMYVLRERVHYPPSVTDQARLLLAIDSHVMCWISWHFTNNSNVGKEKNPLDTGKMKVIFVFPPERQKVISCYRQSACAVSWLAETVAIQLWYTFFQEVKLYPLFTVVWKTEKPKLIRHLFRHLFVLVAYNLWYLWTSGMCFCVSWKLFLKLNLECREHCSCTNCCI